MKKKKEAIITARMTLADKERIQKKAEQAGMTVTDYLTSCALGKEIVRVEGLAGTRAELNAHRRHLSQHTTLANMGKLTVLRSDDLADGYAAICEHLRRILREVT